ncbi:zinc transporter, ZIP family [Pelomyxa schiedti]|nr:zinc transporter, ZIP family [Pelomyxa schiedti]
MASASDYEAVAALTAFPTIAMIGGSIVVVWRSPGPRLSAALQQFASGVVMCAIATEFAPVLLSSAVPKRNYPSASESDLNKWASRGASYSAKLIGFVVGVVLMFAVEAISDYFAEKFEKESKKAQASTPVGSFTNRRTSVQDVEDTALLPTTRYGWRGVPWGLVLSITLNSVLDGLLISISFSASADLSAGAIVSFALAIEMCFVGVSMSTSLRKTVKRYIVIILCLVIPLFLPLSGLLGALVIPLMGEYGIQLLYAFGVSNLIFLVVCELLAEAHETKGADVWWVHIWFFIGFFVVLTFDIIADNSEEVSSSSLA